VGLGTLCFKISDSSLPKYWQIFKNFKEFTSEINLISLIRKTNISANYNQNSLFSLVRWTVNFISMEIVKEEILTDTNNSPLYWEYSCPASFL